MWIEMTGKQIYDRWWRIYGMMANVDSPYYAFEELPQKQKDAWNALGSELISNQVLTELDIEHLRQKYCTPAGAKEFLTRSGFIEGES